MNIQKMAFSCKKPILGYWAVAVCFYLLAIGCSSKPNNVKTVDVLPAIYPDYVDVTIPEGIAPLNFCMSDDSTTTIDVTIKGSKEGTLHSGGHAYTDFDIDQWHQLTTANKGGSLTVTVCAEKHSEWTQYRSFNIYISQDPLEEWGITYRRIAPGYEQYGLMGLYQRNLSTFEEEVLIDNTKTPGMCINCHTANGTDPNQYTFHVRGEHGATAVCKNGNIVTLEARNDSLGGAMVYPYWHPEGRFCAYSTNKTSQMFHTTGKKRIEVYDSSSDVFIYDTETATILKDTIVMKTYWAENTPAFSPDGNWLYFTTARRQVYPTDYNKEMYSLCRVSFDKASGKLDTHVDTLINANEIGKSVTWPRPSYDGRFLMYTLVDYGYFSIWHPEADLWLLDLQTGKSHSLDSVNTQRAESLHSWSKNSKWFLFTSRRDDGLYSRIYISHINNDGEATKPFMLPQQDPKKFYRLLLQSYNTPDFTLQPVSTNQQELQRQIESEKRVAAKISR